MAPFFVQIFRRSHRLYRERCCDELSTKSQTIPRKILRRTFDEVTDYTEKDVATNFRRRHRLYRERCCDELSTKSQTIPRKMLRRTFDEVADFAERCKMLRRSRRLRRTIVEYVVKAM